MTGRIRISTMAAMAALASCAVFAGPVQAEFESEGNATLTTSSNELESFQVKAGGTTISCTGTKIELGFIKLGPVTIIALLKTWSTCHDVFSQKVTVDSNDCKWQENLEANSTTGTTDIECPTSTGIQLTIGSLCTYEIDSQTGLGSTTFKNTGTSSTREILVEPNITGMVITRTTNDFPFLCPAGGSEGTYVGNSTMTGETESGSHVGVYVD